ncbi:unnamed protein product [Closterium sp. NIES-65]|nr:unnamed protein product [Closterium sp. NIES-65]
MAFPSRSLTLVAVFLAAAALLAALPSASAAGVNYSKSGLDWEVCESPPRPVWVGGVRAWEGLKGGVCESGERQSPINIVMDEATTVDAPEKFALEYDSAPTSATVGNKGYTVQVVPNPNHTYKLHIASGTYELKQVHVHAFSEHAINGLFAPMEAHFVHAHTDDPSKLAVVGIMLRLQRDDHTSDWVHSWLGKTLSEVNGTATIDVPKNF